MVEVVKEGKQGIPLSVVYAVCVMPVESVCAVLEPETRSILALASPCCPRPEPHVASATLDFRVFNDGCVGSHLDLDHDIHRHVSSSYLS
jgi:hypothetical protein